MKRIFTILILTLATNCSFGQFPISADTLYSFIKYNSIHRNKVNWAAIDIDFRNNIAASKTINDTMSCFVKVFEKLSDVHSQIYLNNKFYGYYEQYNDSTINLLRPLIEKSNNQTNKIYTEKLEEKYAYVVVPGMQVYDKVQINKLAQSLSDSMAKYSSKKIRGFIIDLRLNGGGNLYPMLSGLSLLLGDNLVGYETDVNDTVTRKWEIKNGNLNLANFQTTDIKTTSLKRLQNIPVVVLLGPVTRSSGSMTGITFKGRPNTYFIGEPTANGYTTSNGYFQFASNLTLNFATNFVADRNKIIYKYSVKPDLEIYGGDNFDDLQKDKKISEALKWLKKNNSR